MLIVFAVVSLLFAWGAPYAKRWIVHSQLFYRLDVAIDARDQTLTAWHNAWNNGNSSAEAHLRQEYFERRDEMEAVLDELTKVWP